MNTKALKPHRRTALLAPHVEHIRQLRRAGLTWEEVKDIANQHIANRWHNWRAFRTTFEFAERALEKGIIGGPLLKQKRIPNVKI